MIQSIINKLKIRCMDLDEDTWDKIKNNVIIVLSDYEIKEKCTDVVVQYEDNRIKAINMFFVAKKVEGCTDKTIRYYETVIKKFFCIITEDIQSITPDHIRLYIAKRSIEGLSKTSQDNELRVLRSFFKYTVGNGYIEKDPTLPIKAIKKEKRIKKPFSEKEMELLRQNAESKRDKALIEVLYSTAARVSEVSGMNIDDISDNEIIVFGKGEKERIVYLNEKAKLLLSQYLSERSDENKALFVTKNKPNRRLSKSAIERAVREIGKRAGVDNVHPHRFRRTTATRALNRGMPIEEISKMLGHESIGTTTIYARSEMKNVKRDHERFIS